MCFSIHARSKQNKAWKNRFVYKVVCRLSDDGFVGPYYSKGRYHLGQMFESSLVSWRRDPHRPESIRGNFASAGVYVYRTLKLARKERNVNTHRVILKLEVCERDFLLHDYYNKIATYTRALPVEIIK